MKRGGGPARRPRRAPPIIADLFDHQYFWPAGLRTPGGIIISKYSYDSGILTDQAMRRPLVWSSKIEMGSWKTFALLVPTGQCESSSTLVVVLLADIAACIDDPQPYKTEHPTTNKPFSFIPPWKTCVSTDVSS